MKNASDNSSVFPTPPGSLDSVGIEFDPGMTLRDYLVARIFPVILSKMTKGDDPKTAISTSFALADMILEARSK